MSASYPSLIAQAWCSTSSGHQGQLTAISTFQAGASGSAQASLADGFPLVTMQSNGTPPLGADFNGILNWITQHLVWLSSGGQYQFSSSQAASPGYPVGAVIQLNSGLGSYLNTLAGNTYDPNGASPLTNNWSPWAGSTMQTWVTGQLGSYLSTATAASTYLTQTNAASTYLTQTNATSTYLTQTNATSTYVSLSNLALTTATQGAGLMGYSSGSAYAAGTVGNAIKALGSGSRVRANSGYTTLNITLGASATQMSGAGISATPTTTGTLLVTVQGWYSSSTTFNGSSGVGLKFFACYGTGTAPTNGQTPLQGTQLGLGLAGAPVASANTYLPFSYTAVITGLTLSTAYWLDLGTSSGTGVTSAQIFLSGLTAVEI